MVKVLLRGGKVGMEIRPLYFEKAFGLSVRNARIISFGACNFSCPYCKREGQFRVDDGSIVSARDCGLDDLYRVCDDAHDQGQVIRLSGGDPVVFPKESLAIAEYMRARYGEKISMAHNGSSPAFAARIAPFLESAAIDLKALPAEMNLRAGLKNGSGERMFYRSLETHNVLASSGVRVDVRTPIFGTTTLDDMLAMAKHIILGGKLEMKFWTWRLYKHVRGCDWPTPHQGQVLWMIQEVKKVHPELRIGLRAKWEPSGFMYF